MKHILLLSLFLVACTTTETREQTRITFVPASELKQEQIPHQLASRQLLSNEERAQVLASVATVSTQYQVELAWLQSHMCSLRSDDVALSLGFVIPAPSEAHLLIEPEQSDVFVRVLVEEKRTVMLKFTILLDGQEISKQGVLRQVTGDASTLHLLNIPISRPGFLRAGSRHLLQIKAQTVGLNPAEEGPVRLSFLPVSLDNFFIGAPVQRRTRAF